MIHMLKMRDNINVCRSWKLVATVIQCIDNICKKIFLDVFSSCQINLQVVSTMYLFLYVDLQCWTFSYWICEM